MTPSETWKARSPHHFDGGGWHGTIAAIRGTTVVAGTLLVQVMSAAAKYARVRGTSIATMIGEFLERGATSGA